MHKQNRLLQVMLPSMASSVSAVILSILTLTAATFYYLTGNGAIYNFLFGANSSAELQGQSQSTINSFSNTVFGNTVLNKVLYFAFWMLVGLMVYFLLYVLIKGASSAVENIEESTYKNARVNEMLHGLVSRLAVRLTLIIGWVVYWIFFVKALLPFSVLATRVGVLEFPELNGWFYTLLGAVVLVISLHIHLIFMRLIALRVRLLDSSDIVT